MFKTFFDLVDGLGRQSKLVIMLTADVIIIFIALLFAYSLRYGEVLPLHHLKNAWPIFPSMMITGAVYAWILSIPKIKLQSFDMKAIQRIAFLSLMLILTAMSLSFLLRLSAPRSVPLIFGILFFTGALFSRINGLIFLRELYNINNTRKNVAIYGAGEAGIQLVSALAQSKEVKPVAFIDDSKLQQQLIIFGLSVFAPDDIEKLVNQKNIDQILVAIPSLSQSHRNKLVKKLSNLHCDIQIMPSHIDIMQGKNILENFKPVKADDLLGRDKFDIDLPNIAAVYKSKSVLVSGAGGSIGSELCRQIIDHKPSKLIIFEQSELALYTIEKELRSIAAQNNIDLVPILGSVCDAKLIEYIFDHHKIEVVFHAAAYKHVPLVEENEISGLKNNIIGTHTLAHQALKSNIETFILISTDKAVRPTNIMGATKRLAELVIQDCDTKSQGTKFSMVRFGNVLGSSGSAK